MIWELTEEHPVVDLTLFKGRNFWAGALALSVGYGLFFGNVVLLPLWLQQYMGYTATQAGMVLAPVGAFALLLSPVVGKNISKVDPRRFAAFAFMVFALVLWMRSHFNTQADFQTIMIPTIIQGVAMAFFFIPLVTITLSGLPPECIPAASGLSNFARISAGAFGTSLATTLWESRASLHHAHLAEAVNPGSPAAQSVLSGLAASGLSNFVRITAGSFGTSIATTIWQDRAAMHHAQISEYVNQGSTATNSALTGLAGAGLTPDQALGTINRLVDQQAYMLAANDVFYASSLIFLLLIPLVFLTRHTKVGAGSADAAAGAH